MYRRHGRYLFVGLIAVVVAVNAPAADFPDVTFGDLIAAVCASGIRLEICVVYDDASHGRTPVPARHYNNELSTAPGRNKWSQTRSGRRLPRALLRTSARLHQLTPGWGRRFHRHFRDRHPFAAEPIPEGVCTYRVRKAPATVLFFTLPRPVTESRLDFAYGMKFFHLPP
jgi:hypothetical protein